MNRLANTFLKNKVVIFIVYMILMKPEFLTFFNSINNLFKVLSILVAFIIAVIYLSGKQKSKLQVAIILFLFVLFISTSLGSKDFYFFLSNYSRFIAISLYTEMLIKNNLEGMFKSLGALISSYIIINFITVLLFPNGFYPEIYQNFYFLGYDNSTVLMVELGLMFLIASSYYFYNKINPFTIFVILVAFFTYLLVWSANNLMCTVILLLFVIFVFNSKKIYKLFKFKFLFWLTIALFLGIIIFRFQNIFSFLIVDVFHKDLTLTGRTYIWDRCLYQIKNNPIFGIGVFNYADRMSLLRIYHAHSTLLNVCLEGGLVGLLAFLNIFRVGGQKLDFKKYVNNKFVLICSFSLFIYFLSTILDVIHNSQMLYVILNLSFYVDFIEKKRRGYHENIDS